MLRVVLADDNRTMRSKLRADLSKFPGGCEVVAECSDGSAAISAALEGSPDLVLLDVVMAPVGGVTAAAVLREKGIKVLLLTSMGQKGVVGDLPYLIKPYSATKLARKIQEVLG